MEILGKMGTVNEHLFGHTTPDNAGTANPIFLSNRNFCAMLGRHTRRTNAAGACPNDEKVKIKSHLICLFGNTLGLSHSPINEGLC
jgi:hypothetical protein